MLANFVTHTDRRPQRAPHGATAQATAKGAIDRTAYGEARHSPQDFATHHVAAISAAVQLADTLVIRNAAAILQFSLSMSG